MMKKSILAALLGMAISQSANAVDLSKMSCVVFLNGVDSMVSAGKEVMATEHLHFVYGYASALKDSGHMSTTRYAKFESKLRAECDKQPSAKVLTLAASISLSE